MMEYPPILSHSFPAPGHGQPRLFNALYGGAIEHRGVFKIPVVNETYKHNTYYTRHEYFPAQMSATTAPSLV